MWFEKKGLDWVIPPVEAQVRALELPEGKIDMVLDTDTFNEVDDQFALAYALLSPERLNVEAIYAAPFYNSRSTGAKDGMEKSYQEIQRLLGKMNRTENVLRGSDAFLQESGYVDSPAARDLVERAMARADGERLYVVAIGAITNVASAILMEPEICEKIAVVWLGGHPTSYPTALEFNLSQDVRAARIVLDCGCPLTLVPCLGVAQPPFDERSGIERVHRREESAVRCAGGAVRGVFGRSFRVGEGDLGRIDDRVSDQSRMGSDEDCSQSAADRRQPLGTRREPASDSRGVFLPPQPDFPRPV